MSRRIKMHFATASCVYVRGWKTRELIREVSGRSPVWSSTARAWVCQTATAMDALAVAESRSIDVVTSGNVPPVEWPIADVEVQVGEPREVVVTEDALW